MYVVSVYNVVCVVLVLLTLTQCRRHHLELQGDDRRYFSLSTFGFYQYGYLVIEVGDFKYSPGGQHKTFGFTLDKTASDAVSPYMETHKDRCILQDSGAMQRDDDSISVMFFTFNLNQSKPVVEVGCDNHISEIDVYAEVPVSVMERQYARLTQATQAVHAVRRKRSAPHTLADMFTDDHLFAPRVRRQVNQQPTPIPQNNESPNDTEQVKTSVTEGKPARKHCKPMTLPMNYNATAQTYSTRIVVVIDKKFQEGLYNLYFHNCENYKNNVARTKISMWVNITEVNSDGNFLSAGEMPLPALYFMMSTVFCLSGGFWIFILHKCKSEKVYKIHYLMALLVFIKSLSLLFHGLNFHFIQTEGNKIETWAVLYYITHLLKGALLFITVILIGTGWAFIKYFLSDKDKKIFMIVIPMQILANIALIIMEESERGLAARITWNEVFILVDLLCCGAILLPVVWSIRHLQDASQNDGKAAISLAKLKLFRHFYIMIVCYIYFTRIIVYLLKITLPFQYEWLDEMFKEMATFVFFVMTGYKFRPSSNNPYLQIPTEEEEVHMDEVLTQTGLTENISKVNRGNTTTHVQDEDDDDEDDEMFDKNEMRQTLLTKRESSHDYD